MKVELRLQSLTADSGLNRSTDRTGAILLPLQSLTVDSGQ